MPRVIVEWLAGRSKETQNALAKKLTEDVVEIVNVKPEAVTVVFKTNERDNWYKGGVSAADKDKQAK